MVTGHVSINDPVGPRSNDRRALGRKVWDITVVILDRPRHEQLIAEVRAAGARIKLIGDGDLTAAIWSRCPAPACTRSWASAARPRACSRPRP